MSRLILVHDEDKLHYIEHICRFYGIDYEYVDDIVTEDVTANPAHSLAEIDAEIARVRKEDRNKGGRPKGSKDSKPRKRAVL